MKKRTNKRVALLIPFALLASFAFAGMPGSASAQSNTANKVVDYETLQGTMNSDGSVSRLRLLDDLRVTGTGDVVVVDPNSTTGLRNLMGYSGPQADGTNQVKYTINNLDGTKQYLTVSDPVGKQPPVAMSVAYTLDGQSVGSGADLVGKSGEIGISFTVKNTTSKTMNVTYKDTQGDTISTPQQVPLPLVAQLQVSLPPNVFTQVEAPGSDIVTDAFGNKLVNWSLVLVPPVGDVTQTVTLNAQADDFSLGQVQLAAAPVAPQDRQYLSYAEDQFQNASSTSGSLYTGTLGLADQLDQVNGGALKIIGGLEKLYKGQLKLANGLAGAIDPNGELITGLGKLKGGLNGLIGGLNKVKAGIGPAKPQLVNGVAKLQDGLALMQGCLTGGATDCFNPKDHSHNPSITNIATQMNAGLTFCLRNTLPGLCSLPTGAVNPVMKSALWIKDGPPGTLGGPGGVTGCLENNSGASSCYGGKSIYDLAASVLANPACSGDAGCSADLNDLQASVTALRNGILAMVDDLDTTTNDMYKVFVTGHGKTPGALTGINLIAQGVSDGIGSDSVAAVNACDKNSANCSVRSGLGLLEKSVTDGFAQLLAGLGSASPAAVNACLGDSSKCTLLSGEGAVLNGIGQLETGLTSGLQTAVDGANIIATCIGAPGNQCKPPGAAKGGPSVKGGMSQLQQGVYAINELGVKEVARQAHDTQGTIGAQLAVMQAEDKRAQEESLLYGPPTSDQAETVVGGSSVLLTMNALDNGHSETVSRGVYAGIALLLLVGLGLLGLRGLRKPTA